MEPAVPADGADDMPAAEDISLVSAEPYEPNSLTQGSREVVRLPVGLDNFPGQLQLGRSSNSHAVNRIHGHAKVGLVLMSETPEMSSTASITNSVVLSRFQ